MLVVALGCTSVHAQYHGKVGDIENPAWIKKQMEGPKGIRSAVEKNFQACNEENLRMLSDSITSYCPGKKVFLAEAKKMFEDCDVYYRLVDLEYSVSGSSTAYPKGPHIMVYVTQWTVPKNDDDALDYSEFRQRSAMLPQWELVRYQLECHKENGVYKTHVIRGPMIEAEWPKGKTEKDFDPRSDERAPVGSR